MFSTGAITPPRPSVSKRWLHISRAASKSRGLSSIIPPDCESGIELNCSPPPVLPIWPDANFVGNSALGRASSGKLFWDDEAVHRASGQGRSLLFYRRLSFDDFAVRCRRAAAEHDGCGAGFSGLRARCERIDFLSQVRSAVGD